MGLIDLSGVGGSAWVGFPMPFHFGAPEFPVTAVVAMSIVMAVVFAESTASMLAVSEITGKPLKKADLARGWWPTGCREFWAESSMPLSTPFSRRMSALLPRPGCTAGT